MALLGELKNRGCIHDVSHFEELEKLLEKPPISFYCGFDPTADSLHVGSMLPLILMRRLQNKGHQPIVLLGSGTGMIGDPSGKSEERVLLDEATIEKNLKGIEKQISRFMSPEGANGYKLVKNHEWLQSLDLISFLRDIGKHVSVNTMLSKESVKARLENREQGISYTEFSYMLLQAYDFYWLHQHHNCVLQVGGSDQWGNITAGMDLIRKKANAPAYGMTFPLLTTAAGAKFGKTAEGAIWLDPTRTSPYKFYQYWINTADEDVIRFIRLFTEAEEQLVSELEKKVSEKPEAREAQQYLAKTLTQLVHGADETDKALQAANVLFGGSVENISASTLRDIFSDVPSFEVSKDNFSKGTEITELLVSCGVSKSKGEARRLIEGGGIYINNERVKDLKLNVTKDYLIDSSLLIIRSGKKKYYLVSTAN